MVGLNRPDNREGGMIGMKKTFFITGLLVFALMLPATSALSASSPMDQLKVSIDKILEILKDPDLKAEDQTEQRREALKIAIKERFSFKKMGQFSLARHWRTLSSEQQEEFLTLFGKLLEETYLSKIETYTNETIDYDKEDISGSKAKVFSTIKTKEVEIPLEYRMFRATSNEWMVYDILIEGVSMIKNYRTQFDELMQKGDLNNLLEELKKKIAE